jgi:hypothetical protein
MLAALFVTIRRIGRIGSFFCWWIALQALVLPIYALLPLEPPWMANHEVIRIVAIPHGGSIPDANPLAALPSLHVAFPLTISLWFFRERWKLPAIVMLAYSSIVAFEVVFSGEHYVVDVLAACATAGFIYFAARIDYAGAFRSLGRAAGTVLARPVGQPALAAARSVDERERGQTLIEFAFALPIILLILLVLVDFGIALDHRIVMQHAVSEGVREAAVSDNVSDIVNTTVDQSQGLVSAGDVTVCYEDVDGNGDPGDVGDKVRVSASYTYTFSAGGGELMQAFGVTPPAITMSPSYTTALQSPVTGATPC